MFCAAHPLMEGISGLYIYRCAVVEPSHEAQSHGTAAALWELSEQIIKTKMGDNLKFINTQFLSVLF